MVACVRTLHRAVRPETDLWLFTSLDIRLWEAELLYNGFMHGLGTRREEEVEKTSEA